MRVFISHSSRDKWIARQIASELEGRGIDAFLDEKDIATGDSIEKTVKTELAGCDELLIIFSPASLRSPWVLIEVGGAQALGKRLVPILHHIGPNELPTPIASGLARDLNDIERYYKEVEVRNQQRDTEQQEEEVSLAEEATEIPVARATTLSAGQRVRLPLREPSSTLGRDGRDIGWNSFMSDLLGVDATIVDFDKDSGVVHLDIDHGRFLWLADWLTPLHPNES